MIICLIDRLENQCGILLGFTSDQLIKHQMKTMDIAVEVLRMEISLVFLDGVFKEPTGKVGRDLREDIFALVHDLQL